MAEEPTNPAPLGEITQGPSKVEEFLDRHMTKLIFLVLALVIAAAAYIVIGGMRESEDNAAGEALSAAVNEDGSYDTAALRDVIDSFAESPASGSASLLLADEQWEAGNREEALETLRGFLSGNPDHPGVPNALIALANHLLTLEKKAEAITSFQKVVDHPEGRYLAPFALLSLGDLAKADGNEEDARAYYEKARDDYPNNSLTVRQFVNNRLALLGVQPPTEIEPPAVPEPTPEPVPTTPVPGLPGPNTPFPELLPKPVTPDEPLTIPTLPADEEPATEEPATEKPATEEPATEEPVTEEPATEEPATEEPATEEPATEEPATEEPVTEEPATEEPATEEPASEEPASAEEGEGATPGPDSPAGEETEAPAAEEPATGAAEDAGALAGDGDPDPTPPTE